MVDVRPVRASDRCRRCRKKMGEPVTCSWCGVERDAPAAGPHTCDPRRVLEVAALVCDNVSRSMPKNRLADDARATFRAAACECAWLLRQKAKGA